MSRPFLVCVLFCVFFGHTVNAQPRQPLAYRGTGNYYRVIGPSNAAVTYTISLSDALGEFAARYLPVQADPRRLEVKLVPPTSASFPDRVSVQVNRFAEVTVAVPFTGRLDQRALIVALTQGLLLRTMAREKGVDQAGDYPLWIEGGLAARFETFIRPAMQRHYQRRATEFEPMSLTKLFNATRPVEQPERLLVNSYLFWDGMERVLGSRTDRKLFFSRALAGSRVDGLMRNTGEPQFNEMARRDLWWLTTYMGHSVAQRGPLLTMRQSRERLRELISINVVIDGREVPAGIAELWQSRQQPGLRSALEERLAEIKANALEANPVYQDAILALGEVVQALLQANEKEQFDNAARRFLRSLNRSEQQASAIQSAVTDLQTGERQP